MRRHDHRQATHLLLCVSVVCMCVLCVCLCRVCMCVCLWHVHVCVLCASVVLARVFCTQVGYIPLSYDRDHEVELAQVAPDEQGRDTRLHVQVRTGAAPPPWLYSVLVVCACVLAAALVVPCAVYLAGCVACGAPCFRVQRASGGRAELTSVLCVCLSVCLPVRLSVCLFLQGNFNSKRGAAAVADRFPDTRFTAVFCDYFR